MKYGQGSFTDIFFKKQEIELAPDPTDILWENMNVKRSIRVRNVILVFIGTVTMSFTCFVMIYIFNVIKQTE